MRDELISIVTERIYEIRTDDPDIIDEDLKEQLYDEILDIVDGTVALVANGEDKELQYF